MLVCSVVLVVLLIDSICVVDRDYDHCEAETRMCMPAKWAVLLSVCRGS